MYQTDMYEGMLAETTTIHGHNGDSINAYIAKPLGPGPFPGMVLIHHVPGWDEWYREAARRYAHHGYVAISPNLYHRSGNGTPTDIAAKVRESGGISDEQALGDIEGSMRFLRTLPYLNVPVLDLTPPTSGELQAVCRFIDGRIGAGPIYLHCALGYGRSAVAAAAYLLYAGHAATVTEAVETVRRARPKVVLTDAHAAALNSFAGVGPFRIPARRVHGCRPPANCKVIPRLGDKDP